MTDTDIIIRACILMVCAIVGGLIGAVASASFPGENIFGPLSAAVLGALIILAVRKHRGRI